MPFFSKPPMGFAGFLTVSGVLGWSGSLQFTVERSGKTLVGSAASGEGLVNVYRGTGRVMLAPLTPSQSMFAATNMKNAK